MIDAKLVSLGILAGGRGARLGGADKALLQYQGMTLLERALRTLPEPFADRLLSYNREPGALVIAAGLRLVPDLRAEQTGPLAALEALFHACRSPWLLTVPVDIRDWPEDLAADLLRATLGDADGCVVRDVDGLQPLVGLWNIAALRTDLGQALDNSERAVHRWLESHALPVHDISPWCLGNLNSPADFVSR